jgi:hypothetical protein
VPNVTIRAEGTDQNSKNISPSEAIMDGSRNERARAERIIKAPVPDVPSEFL